MKIATTTATQTTTTTTSATTVATLETAPFAVKIISPTVLELLGSDNVTEAAHGGSITGGYVARVSLGTVHVSSMLFQREGLEVSTDDSHGFVPDDNIMIFDIKEESWQLASQ